MRRPCIPLLQLWFHTPNLVRCHQQPGCRHCLCVFTDRQAPYWSRGWVQRCACQSYRRCVCQSGRCVRGCSPSGWRGTGRPWQQQDTPAWKVSWLLHTSKCTFMWAWIEGRIPFFSPITVVSSERNRITSHTLQWGREPGDKQSWHSQYFAASQQ